jgi:hypothetical protein
LQRPPVGDALRRAIGLKRLVEPLARASVGPAVADERLVFVFAQFGPRAACARWCAGFARGSRAGPASGRTHREEPRPPHPSRRAPSAHHQDEEDGASRTTRRLLPKGKGNRRLTAPARCALRSHAGGRRRMTS